MIRLVDVEPSLALFTEGLAGQYLHIKSRDEFTGRAHFSGTSGQTSDTLYLPSELPNTATDSAFRVLAMQQIAQRLYGTYQLRLEQVLQHLPHLDERQPNAGTLSLRQGDLQGWYQLYPHPGLLAQIFHLFEATRTDAAMLRQHPGMTKHYRHYYVQNTEAQEFDAALFSQAEQVAQHIVCDASTQLTLEPSEPLLLQVLTKPLSQLASPSAASVYDSVLAADACYEQLVALTVGDRLPGPAEALETEEDWTQRDVRLEDWDDEIAQLNQQMMAAQVMEEAEVDAAEGNADGGDIKPDEVSIRSLTEQRDTLSRRADMERSAIRHALGPAHPDTRSYLYDEWDYQEQRYHRAYCRLYEERLLADEANGDLAEAMEVVRRWQPEVKARLAHIKPLGYQRQPRVEDGDELDFNALLQARLDLRTGHSPDDRIYSRRERVRRDLGAAFLVDLSASTDDPLEKPEPEPYDLDEDGEPLNLRDPFLEFEPTPIAQTSRRIIDVQREAMLVMASALESLGDDHGIYGFSGYGRDCVEFYVAKELGEAFGAQTLNSISAMQPKRSTRMGPAIRHATRKLVAAGYAQKLLLILSDGFPQDCDYGPDRGEHEYGVQDTAKALLEAEAKGVDTFCVTVDRSGHDYLARMCPSANYLIIDEIEDLPAALTKVYQALAGR